MTAEIPAIEIRGLVRKFRNTEAVNGLDLTVKRGRCYGFFGRNGAGKTTTIKCILNHLRPTSGIIRVFGIEPQRDEVAVKSKLTYVPENVAFYPWMTVRGMLDYAASFREHWSRRLEEDLIERFGLDVKKKISGLSKGMRAQLALLCAVCPEPEMLLLDEPTSGLDPIVRREFIRTVIGAYQEGDPGNRTVFVSTHMIAEFEGLIDEYTIIEDGKALMTCEAETARETFKRVRLRFDGDLPNVAGEGIAHVEANGTQLEILTSEFTEDLKVRLSEYHPVEMQIENLTLEEIFVATPHLRGKE
ncbi:MAG: ABC transporter ATP-binding protein [Candidatus Omnitrophica bacterium]|nr:ABC transporter ATP-binding protein [Candidatus Omnitrophota bacterium]